MSFSLIVFNFLLCRFEAMADMFDVQAQFNGGEPQRLKVRYLGVTLRGLNDRLNEFNPGDTRRVKYVRYKRPTFDDRRISFSWVELRNDDVTSMFWEHNMLSWIDMRVTLLRSTKDILNSLIPLEDRD